MSLNVSKKDVRRIKLVNPTLGFQIQKIVQVRINYDFSLKFRIFISLNSWKSLVRLDAYISGSIEMNYKLFEIDGIPYRFGYNERDIVAKWDMDDLHDLSLDEKLQACKVYCTSMENCKSINWCHDSNTPECVLLDFGPEIDPDSYISETCFSYYKVELGRN